MSFVVDKIELKNFRSYEHACIELSEKITVLYGANGAGKTNIIEALQLLTTGESFRNPSKEQLVRVGESDLKLSLFARDGLRRREVYIQQQGPKRSFTVNGKSAHSPRLVKGEIPSVLFTPDDLLLIKDSADIRRSELDILGSLLAKRYEALVAKYRRVLIQRNRLLKQEQKDILLFEILTDQLCHLGATLIKQRVLLLKRLFPYIRDFYSKIDSKENISVSYLRRRSGNTRAIMLEDFDEFLARDVDLLYQELKVEFEHQKEKEFFQKVTLAGPHRDDFTFYLNNKNIRDYGSQGQQRSVVLSIKIAESLLIEEVLGKKPLLLLDDVFSELDLTRRQALFEIIMNFGQTVITTAHLNYLGEELLRRAQVVEISKDSFSCALPKSAQEEEVFKSSDNSEDFTTTHNNERSKTTHNNESLKIANTDESGEEKS